MPEETIAIDTGNYQMVGMNGGDIVVLRPKARMTKAEALRHAAWLVALASDADEPIDGFTPILEAVLEI